MKQGFTEFKKEKVLDVQRMTKEFQVKEKEKSLRKTGAIRSVIEVSLAVIHSCNLSTREAEEGRF